MQIFDAFAEQSRPDLASRDTFLVADDGRTEAKPINFLVHERMAERFLLSFDAFDVAAYVDYGRKFYDKNEQADGRGVPFDSMPEDAGSR